MVTIETPQTTTLGVIGSSTLNWCRALQYREALRDLQSEYEASSSHLSDIGMGLLARRPLLDYPIDTLATLEDVKSVLEKWDEPGLASRVEYFASDEDLEEGEMPLALASAQEFLKFFGVVNTEGMIHLACTPEGWLFAQWEFEDARSAGVWFRDDRRVMFVATDVDGAYVSVDGGSELSSRFLVMQALIRAGLFEWYPDYQATTSSTLTITSPDITAVGPLKRTADPLGRLSAYGTGTSPPTARFSRSTGWNTSIL